MERQRPVLAQQHFQAEQAALLRLAHLKVVAAVRVAQAELVEQVVHPLIQIQVEAAALVQLLLRQAQSAVHLLEQTEVLVEHPQDKQVALMARQL